ncbi:lactonase family protein [Endozoicomonas euniceicola]|uniref:Lactonase family protein n=1 Tax=Endozoicomonas euniceicola TaxID=1234143 RepID=A0ABY6GW42_9GAMM|nr:lactonase family protein [Endozoicomonas euniceicola]UYM16629.1 lactonase family protein [Endozoicomonas euniceicola]
MASNREHNTIALYKIQAATGGQNPIAPMAVNAPNQDGREKSSARTNE